ncbi:NAD-binding Rossmann fold oxidoreductase family protein [Poronia punctata]|nr:NAD-binding Rossmann fold oxidoreductase family protein [Poronia punctata]
MAPIRIGFIGLSKTGWGVQAHLPYLKKQTDKFQIVAIQNSSVESSREAIKLHGLAESTKAYGSPEEIANDPEIDLVVVSVRVDRHKIAAAPSLLAGKDVFVEWPLGRSLSDAEEILSLARKGGSEKTVVGLQARQAPIIKTIRGFIQEGKLGDVLSSTWMANSPMGGAVATDRFRYLVDKGVGGNLYTISAGHSLDYVQQALGSTFTSATALLANRRPTVKLTGSNDEILTESHPKTADDTIFIQGTVGESSIPVLFSLQGGPQFKGTAGLDWRILGTKGELRITSSGPLLSIGSPDQKVEFHDLEKDEVVTVEVEKDGFDEELPLPARNVARIYEGIAGVEGRREFLCSFEDAVERHRFLDGLDKK